MGNKLWELSQQIDEAILHLGMDKDITRGKIGMEAGILMNINAQTRDDEKKIIKLKLAVEKILNVKI